MKRARKSDKPRGVEGSRAKAPAGKNESEERLRALSDASFEAIFISEKGICVEQNLTAEKMFGYSTEEAVGRPGTAWIAPADRDAVMRNMIAGVETPYRVTALRKDGTTFPCEIQARMFDYRGRQVRITALRDITERVRTEEALRREQSFTDTIFEASYDTIFVFDPATGTPLRWNRRFSEASGYSDAEIAGMTAPGAFFDAADLERAAAATTRVVAGGLARLELSLVTKGGERVPFEYVGTVVTTDDNRTVLVSVGREIAERRVAEASLRESEAKFRTLAEESPNMIFINKRGRVVFANRRCEDVMGYRREEFYAPGFDFLSLVSPEQRDRIGENFRSHMSGGDVPPHEYTLVDRAGRRIETIITTTLIDFEGDRSILGIVTDITERKRAELALMASEERFRSLAESLPLTVFEVDLEGHFTYLNVAALEQFGYTPQEVAAGLTMAKVIAPADRERVQQTIARRLSGAEVGFNEYQGLRKDGSMFPVAVVSSPILREGCPVGLRGIALDLTERKALEEERLKTQKLESIGVLAGGIAHDFNNLLQGIFAYLSLAKLTIDDREKTLAMLDQAENALHQSVGLTSQLLTFSRGGTPVKKLVALGPVIEQACRLSLSGSSTRGRILVDDGLWSVEADESQIAQVIQNIVLNADQAMPEGGTVDVRARNAPGGDSSLPRDLPAGNYVELTVSDHGVGVPADSLVKIFDPYFTTKEKGSGLGLATSYSIARNHGGLITVRSAPGAGSTFAVYLPASDAPVRKEPARLPVSPVRRGRVLVMDDDDVVRTAAGELLCVLGHDAELTAHGEQAVERYREALAAGRPFDVVILDLTIPGGMGGLETVRRLRQIDPGVRAVVSSGYSDSAATSAYEEQGFRAFLRKPYTAAGLNDTLNKLLS